MLQSVGRNLRLALALGALGVLVALSGCGDDGKPDKAKGKQLFVQRCGSCHTLADAGTKGQIGPDLDDAFKQSITDGLGRDTIEGVVRKQIELPQGTEMPANLVTGSDADAVAAYVASAIGKSGSTGSTGATGTTQASDGAAKANARNEVSIPTDPSGQLAYQVKSATARAGTVTLLSKNDSQVTHDIAVKGGGVEKAGKEVGDGGTSKVSVKLNPREYTFYCTLPGHEQAGMKGTLTVR